MKKLLAILLAIAMLCAFACVGASAEPAAVDEALKEEALGYVAQVRDIFDSGTFTLKLQKHTVTPGSDYSPQLWIYDKANNRIMLEFSDEFLAIGFSYTDSDAAKNMVFFLVNMFFDTLRRAMPIFGGQTGRAIKTESEIRYCFPEISAITADTVQVPLLGSFFDFHENFNSVINCRVTEEDVAEVSREGSRISLLCHDGRFFVFEDGVLTYFKHNLDDGFEWFIEQLSPEVDASYFDTEGMQKISMDILAMAFDLLETSVSIPLLLPLAALVGLGAAVELFLKFTFLRIF